MPAAAVVGGAASSALSIPKNGLVALFDAASKASYPGSGSTWFNLAKGGANATGDATCTDVTFSNGTASFNGSTSQAVFTSPQYFTNEQTIVLVLKPVNTTGRRNPYNQAYGGFGTITHEIAGHLSYYHGTRGSDGDLYQGSGSSNTSAGQIVAGEIGMMTVVRNSNSVNWYSNGTLDISYGNSYPAAISTTSTATIGNGYAGRFYGEINFLALYNRALTATEVGRVYQELRWRYGI